MKLNMYCIFDQATGAYMRPIFFQSDGQAARLFQDLAMDAEHEIGRHPEDYSLCRCGVWDDADAQTTVEAVTTITTGLEAVARGRNIDKRQIDALEEKVNGENGSG